MQPSAPTDVGWPRYALTELRDLFVHALAHTLGHRNSRGACLHAAYLIREALPLLVEGALVSVRGGAGGDDIQGGCRDAAGALRGHYWTEVVLTDGSIHVADITADQFGHDPVTWLPIDASRARYVPGDQSTVDDHVSDLASQWLSPCPIRGEG